MLDALELRSADHVRLAKALSETRPEQGVRAMLNQAVRLAVERLSAFDHFRGLFDKTPSFAHIPIAEFGLLVVRAATLIWPQSDAFEASNRLLDNFVTSFNDLPLFKPLIIACEGNAAEFFKIYPTAHGLLYNHGQASCDVHGPQHCSVNFDDVPAGIAQYYGKGYCRGLVRALSGKPPHLVYHRHHPMAFSIEMSW